MIGLVHDTNIIGEYVSIDFYDADDFTKTLDKVKSDHIRGRLGIRRTEKEC